MEKINKDLIAASTIPMVLSILKKGDNYGYAIIKEVQEISGGQLEWKEGSLYPVLTKLEKNKMITSYIVKEKGRNRKYYKIVEEGDNFLEKMRKEWTFINNTMNLLWKEKHVST